MSDALLAQHSTSSVHAELSLGVLPLCTHSLLHHTYSLPPQLTTKEVLFNQTAAVDKGATSLCIDLHRVAQVGMQKAVQRVLS